MSPLYLKTKTTPIVSRLPEQGSGDLGRGERGLFAAHGKTRGAGAADREQRARRPAPWPVLPLLGRARGAPLGDRRKREGEEREEGPPPPRSPLREVMWGQTENTRQGPKKGQQRWTPRQGHYRGGARTARPRQVRAGGCWRSGSALGSRAPSRFQSAED